MKNLVFGLLIVIFFSSCRSTRTISNAIAKKDTTAVVEILPTGAVDTQLLIRTQLKSIADKKIDFNSFNAKVKVDYAGADGKKYDFNANIRMQKDSAIWISANAILGIEALRLLVTADSVKLLNKLEKIYVARSIEYLREITSLPLDLYTLQDLIIGNPVFFDENIIRFDAANGQVSLLSLGVFFKNLATFNQADNSMVRSKLNDADPTKSRTADLTYSDYEIKQGPLFSTRREIVVLEAGRLEVKLEFKNYSFNEPVDFPFSVPRNFQVQ